MRIRTCGLLIRDGMVLLQRKTTDMIWALPGGQVEPGEAPEAALRREFLEELGWAVQVGPLLLTRENRFSHGGAETHQDECCFEVICDSPLGAPQDETLVFRWVSMAEIEDMDVRPAAMRDLIFRNGL